MRVTLGMILVFILAAVLIIGLEEKQGPAGRAGEKIDQAAEDFKNSLEEVGDAIEEETDRLKDD